MSTSTRPRTRWFFRILLFPSWCAPLCGTRPGGRGAEAQDPLFLKASRRGGPKRKAHSAEARSTRAPWTALLRRGNRSAMALASSWRMISRVASSWTIPLRRALFLLTSFDSAIPRSCLSSSMRRPAKTMLASRLAIASNAYTCRPSAAMFSVRSWAIRPLFSIRSSASCRAVTFTPGSSSVPKIRPTQGTNAIPTSMIVTASIVSEGTKSRATAMPRVSTVMSQRRNVVFIVLRSFLAVADG